MPKRGQRVLMPPSGSITPCRRNHPHPPTTAADAKIDPGYQEVRPSGSQTCPAISWNMKRPTRVPVSTVVRMKSASNMMAKWYQSAVRCAPNAPAKICAIPTASEGAPPVRASRVDSPTDAASASICPGETTKPQPRIVSAAVCSEPPRVPSGALIAK